MEFNFLYEPFSQRSKQMKKLFENPLTNFIRARRVSISLPFCAQVEQLTAGKFYNKCVKWITMLKLLRKEIELRITSQHRAFLRLPRVSGSFYNKFICH